MIYDILFYFFLISGVFYLTETILSVFLSNRNLKNTYILTIYEDEDDLQKIVFLARNYNYTIIVYEALNVASYQKEYIESRYFNVKFTNSLESLQEDEWRRN